MKSNSPFLKTLSDAYQQATDIVVRKALGEELVQVLQLVINKELENISVELDYLPNGSMSMDVIASEQYIDEVDEYEDLRCVESISDNSAIYHIT